MIRLIAAVDQKFGIAKNGVQPWKLPSDEQYFQQKTLEYGANILMGRKTFEVIGRPLPDRNNFVVSHENVIAGVTVVHDIEEFLQSFAEDVWVIGGTSLYEQTLELADEIYLTHIAADFKCDQFFPAIADGFQLVSQSDMQQDNGLDFTYALYENKVIARVLETS